MHLTLDELLAVRDGDAAPDAAAHAAACPTCRVEVDRLREMQDALRSLPAQRPDQDLWPALRARLDEERFRRRWIRVGWAAASVALMVTLFAGVRGGIEAYAEARLASQTKALVAHSQQLEKELRSYQTSSPMSGWTVNGVVEIEDRIAVIDARLAQLRDRRAPSVDTVALWRERVTLLDALVAMHATPQDYIGL
jgi:hypothetical protein